MEKRSRPGSVNVRMDGDKPSVIEGYAAVYYDGTRETEYELMPGVIERIMPGAFDDRLDDDIRGLFNHDTNKLLGRNKKSMRLSVDKRGLRYEIDCADTSVCRDLLIHLERGDVTGSSFGFRGAKSDWLWDQEIAGGEYTADIRQVTGFASLFDVGPVTNPAYAGTTAGARDGGEVREALQDHEAAKQRRNAAMLEQRQRDADKLTMLEIRV